MRDLPIPAELAVEVEPFEVDALDGFLASDGNRPFDEVHPAERWTVTDDGSAEWSMRRIAECDVELARLADQLDDWSARLDAWHVKVTGPLKARRDWFADHLERYALAQREASPLDAKGQPKLKTIVLPSGQVKTIGHKAAPVVDDEATVIGWAKESLPDDALAEVIKRVEVIINSGLRKHVQIVEHDDVENGPQLYAIDPKTGEQVPGVSVNPAYVTATVVVS